MKKLVRKAVASDLVLKKKNGSWHEIRINRKQKRERKYPYVIKKRKQKEFKEWWNELWKLENFWMNGNADKEL